MAFIKLDIQAWQEPWSFLELKVCRRFDKLQILLPELEVLEHLDKQQYDVTVSMVPNFNSIVDNSWHLLYKTIDKNFSTVNSSLTIKKEKIDGIVLFPILKIGKVKC